MRDSHNRGFLLGNPVARLDYQSLVGVADLRVVQKEVDGGWVEWVLAVHPDERRPVQGHLHHVLADLGGGGGDQGDQEQRRQERGDGLHFECRSHSLYFDSASRHPWLLHGVASLSLGR